MTSTAQIILPLLHLNWHSGHKRVPVSSLLWIFPKHETTNYNMIMADISPLTWSSTGTIAGFLCLGFTESLSMCMHFSLPVALFAYVCEHI